MRPLPTRLPVAICFVKRYLLDTHLVYWWMTADARLGKATQRIITQSEIVVECRQRMGNGIENTKGKLPLPQGSITNNSKHRISSCYLSCHATVEAVRNLHCAHTDPFRLLLIAQTQDERLTLTDARFSDTWIKIGWRDKG